jgi:general secretion pathway protein F/type IV pilus assembly protein PilC
MPVFAYTARNETGERVQGTVSADNERAALATLDARKLFPTEVKAQAGGGGGLGSLFGRRVKTATLCRFYRQLADLLKAGLPMLRAFNTLQKQNSDLRFAPVLEELRLAITGGAELAEAMSHFPDIFAELEVGMIRAGERGGFLEDVLMRMAQFTERSRELKGQVTGALIYPAVLMLAGIGVIIVMMTAVLPAFAQMLEGMGQMPLPTKIVMGISKFLQQSWPLVLLAAAAATAGFVGWARSPAGRLAMDTFKLKVPILKGVMLQTATARFARTLGTLLGAGVQIGQALKISAEAVGNKVLAEEVSAAAERVRQGETLATPLAKSKYFPPMLTEMVAIGEETGLLDKVLIEAAVGYEREADRAVSMLVKLLEPLVLVFMTGVVLTIALAVILPALNAAASMSRGK